MAAVEAPRHDGWHYLDADMIQITPDDGVDVVEILQDICHTQAQRTTELMENSPLRNKTIRFLQPPPSRDPPLELSGTDTLSELKAFPEGVCKKIVIDGETFTVIKQRRHTGIGEQYQHCSGLLRTAHEQRLLGLSEEARTTLGQLLNALTTLEDETRRAQLIVDLSLKFRNYNDVDLSMFNDGLINDVERKSALRELLGAIGPELPDFRVKEEVKKECEAMLKPTTYERLSRQALNVSLDTLTSRIACRMVNEYWTNQRVFPLRIGDEESAFLEAENARTPQIYAAAITLGHNEHLELIVKCTNYLVYQERLEDPIPEDVLHTLIGRAAGKVSDGWRDPRGEEEDLVASMTSDNTHLIKARQLTAECAMPYIKAHALQGIGKCIRNGLSEIEAMKRQEGPFLINAHTFELIV